jgi:hypothetical protein
VPLPRSAPVGLGQQTEDTRAARWSGRPVAHRLNLGQGDDRVPWGGVGRRRCDGSTLNSVTQVVTARGASCVSVLGEPVWSLAMDSSDR